MDTKKYIYKKMITWSDSEDSSSNEEEEVANLCFMTYEDEVRSEIKNDIEFTFDELQDAFDEIENDFKKLKLKNKKLKE